MQKPSEEAVVIEGLEGLKEKAEMVVWPDNTMRAL